MKNKVVKAGIGYTLGNYLVKGLVFFTLPLYSRLMTTEDYGNYSVFLSYENILFIILGFAIHTSYKSAKYKYDSNKERDVGLSYAEYVSVTMIFLSISAVLWLIIVNVLGYQWLDILSLDKIGANLLVIYSFSSAVIACFNSDSSINYRSDKYVKISVINAVGNTAISILLMLSILKDCKYYARVLGTVVPSMILAMLIIYSYLKTVKAKNYGRYLKWGISYSSPLILHGLSQVVLSQFDRIMIKKMIDSSAAGIYSFSYNILMIVSVTSSSIDNVWSTWVYEKIDKRDFDSIKKYAGYYTLGMFMMVVCIMLASPELIMILGGEKYRSAKMIVLPIVASGFFVFLYTIPSVAEYYSGNTMYIALSTVSSAIINIILNFVFINQYGYIAAAYTTLFTYILYFVFHYLVIKKIMPEYRLPLRMIVICSTIIIILCIAENLVIDCFLIRWSVIVIILIASLMIEEKKFGYVNHILLKQKNI